MIVITINSISIQSGEHVDVQDLQSGSSACMSSPGDLPPLPTDLLGSNLSGSGKYCWGVGVGECGLGGSTWMFETCTRDLVPDIT